MVSLNAVEESELVEVHFIAPLATTEKVVLPMNTTDRTKENSQSPTPVSNEEEFESVNDWDIDPETELYFEKIDRAAITRGEARAALKRVHIYRTEARDGIFKFSDFVLILDAADLAEMIPIPIAIGDNFRGRMQERAQAWDNSFVYLHQKCVVQ